MADKKKSGVSRRDLLKRAGMAGAAMTIPLTPVGGRHPEAAVATVTPVPDVINTAQAARREPIENLTAAEADLLEGICARIIPTEASGPGAHALGPRCVMEFKFAGRFPQYAQPAFAP